MNIHGSSDVSPCRGSTESFELKLQYQRFNRLDKEIKQVASTCWTYQLMTQFSLSSCNQIPNILAAHQCTLNTASLFRSKYFYKTAHQNKTPSLGKISAIEESIIGSSTLLFHPFWQLLNSKTWSTYDLLSFTHQLHFDTQRLLLTKNGLSIRTDQNYHDTFIEKPNIDALTALCVIYRWEVIKDKRFQSKSLRSLILNMVYYVCCQHEMLFPVGFFIAKQLATDDMDEDKLGRAVKFAMDKLPEKENTKYLDMVLPYTDSNPTFIPATLSAVSDEGLFYAGCYFHQYLLKEGLTTRQISLLPNVAI